MAEFNPDNLTPDQRAQYEGLDDEQKAFVASAGDVFQHPDGTRKTTQELNEAEPLIRPIGSAIITTIQAMTGLPPELIMMTQGETVVQSAAVAAAYIRKDIISYL